MSQLQAQESIPDGTTGERLEMVESDTLPEKWRDKRWRLFNGRFTTFKMGGGILLDYAAFGPDENTVRQMDSMSASLKPSFAVRDCRITMSGQLKTKKIISWKAGIMYDDGYKEWLVRETGIMFHFPALHSSFFFGRTKEGFSMNKVMVGYAGWTMERQMAIDVIPILADGIKWLGYLPEMRIFWNAGVYGDYLSKSQSFSTYRMQFSLRAGWLPVNDETNHKLFHLGFNYRYGLPENGEINVRSRPEVNESPFFIETGKFSSDFSNHWGIEIYYRKKAFLIGTEMYRHDFHSEVALNPTFYGGDVVVSYLLTGESRPYHSLSSVLGFVPVSKPLFKGVPGAWEVLCRFSSLNLTDGALNGGSFWRITPMINWYLSKDVRLELVYGYGVLDRFQLKGSTHFYQCRLQFTLL